MDPPPYGRGPEGEKCLCRNSWKNLCTWHRFIGSENYFFILSTYAAGLFAIVGLNVAKSYFDVSRAEFGELFLKSANGKDLPMGTFLRIRSGGEGSSDDNV
jgi:23S rRNA (cytosine1962-C5)-methyltransferase